MSEGKIWQEQRKFLHATLNDLGMGSKDKMEAIIEQETLVLQERIREITKGNKPLKVNTFFLHTVNNIIWRMIMSPYTFL